MEAKDTIMDVFDSANIFYRGEGTLEAVCKAQAEISFKAGIREAVEWMKGRVILDGVETYNEWHSKLREWGIE